MPSEWVIVTQDRCKFCDKAKELLHSRGVFDYASYNISSSPDIKNLVRSLGFETVPIIWYRGMLIGGYEALDMFFNRET